MVTAMLLTTKSRELFSALYSLFSTSSLAYLMFLTASYKSLEKRSENFCLNTTSQCQHTSNVATVDAEDIAGYFCSISRFNLFLRRITNSEAIYLKH